MLWNEAVANTFHCLNIDPPFPFQLMLEMSDMFFDHPKPTGVMPAQPLFQELALMDHLADSPRQVDEERVLTIGEHHRLIGEKDLVALEVNHQVAEA